MDVASFIESNKQALARILVAPDRKPTFVRSCPVDVSRPLSMTCLASHADFRKTCGKAIVVGIVVLAHASRMTFSAHEIPILIEPGPVQHIVVLDVFVGIEMKPTLAALLFRARVPGNRQCLHPTIGEFNEILLQRIDAECVLDLEGGELAIRSVGFDEILSVFAEETGKHAVIVEARIVEIAEHKSFCRVLHRTLMLRAVPQRRLRAMTAGAGLATHEARFTGGVLERIPSEADR